MYKELADRVGVARLWLDEDYVCGVGNWRSTMDFGVVTTSPTLITLFLLHVAVVVVCLPGQGGTEVDTSAEDAKRG